jgi:carboxymethylenebutenolidase
MSRHRFSRGDSLDRMKADDFPPDVLKLFDGYIHGSIDRREFLDRAAKYAFGGFTAAAMLESLKPNYALAQQVAKDDARIKTEYLNYPSPDGSGTMRGYFARPADPAGKWPGVVVIHENRGLNPYIEDVARRLAVENFVAFKYQMYLYPGTNHGFHNDTTPRYDEAAAKLAWSPTLAFFNENLRA